MTAAVTVARYITPETLHRISGWLENLGRLTRHVEPPDTDQIAVYADMLSRDFPASAFDSRSLHAVAEGLTWWPAYDEIRKRLAEWRRARNPAPTTAIPEPINTRRPWERREGETSVDYRRRREAEIRQPKAEMGQ